MAKTDSHDIDVLKHLISKTIDSAESYAEAAKKVKNTYLSGSLLRWSDERQQVVELLRTQIDALGGNPEIDGSVLVSVHRLLANLRAILSSGDTAVVNAVEYGEGRILHAYEEVLKDLEVSTPTRCTIERAFASVLTGHDQASALKHSMRT